MASRQISIQADSPKLYAWTPANVDSRQHDLQTREFERPRIPPDQHDRRIYIVGAGNIGRLFAMCLAKLEDRPPITLIVHRTELLQEWVTSPGIELVRYGISERTIEFDIEYWTEKAPLHGPVREAASGKQVANLIVATKASAALNQVDCLRPYLDESSTVAFAQNGMCKLWPPLGDAYVNDRFPSGKVPSWLACVITHGVTSLGPFKSLHASPAGVMVGSVSNKFSSSAPSSSEYLATQLCRAPGLGAKHIPSRQLWIAQLEKLAVNVVINPLTAVLRCKNGEIFIDRGDDLPKVIELLLSEASQVFQALLEHPDSEAVIKGTAEETQHDNAGLAKSRAQLTERFSVDNLKSMVYDVGEKVAQNRSSMLQDIVAGKTTEIYDLNGWLVDTAEFLSTKGISLPVNQAVIDMVVGMEKLERVELCERLLSKRRD